MDNPTDAATLIARINSFRTQANKFCEPWHALVEKSRRLYDFDHFDKKPKQGESQYADPTYTNVVDLAVGVLLANQLDWSAYGFRPSLKEESDSSRIEKFLAGVLAQNSEREEYSINYESITNFVRDGAAVIYTVWDGELAESGIENHETVDGQGEVQAGSIFTNMPLRVQVIDPLKMTMLPGGPGRWAKVFRTEKKTIFDVEQEYGVTLAKYSNLNPDEKMRTEGELIDFWEVCARPESTEAHDREAAASELDWFSTQPYAFRNTIVFDGEFVIPPRLMPGYTDYPYTIGFFKPVNREKPALWGHGILQPLESSVALLERSINRRQRQIDVYSSLPIVVKALAGRDVSIDPGLATSVHLTPEEDVGFPMWPGNPPDVATQIDFLRSRVQQSGFSDVMYGSGSASSSGYALSQLGDQNRIRLTQPVEHLNLMFTKVGHKIVQLAVHFASNAFIQVYGTARGQNFSEAVRGLDLAGYRVQAEIHPVFPNEEVRKHAMATQVAGILSEVTIMERYLGVKQPSDERQRKMRELVFKNPVMQQFTMIAALKEIVREGGEDAEAAALTLQMVQQGMVNNPQGRPTEPNAMAQMSGMMSPTGQPTGQEAGGMPPGQSEMDQMQNAAGAAPNMQGVVQ
jgi:hypothetical protein